MLSNAEVDRLIAELRTHPLGEGELRQVKEGLYVSLSQSQPEGLEPGFCLSAGGRLYFFFWQASCGSAAPSPLLDALRSAEMFSLAPEHASCEAFRPRFIDGRSSNPG